MPFTLLDTQLIRSIVSVCGLQHLTGNIMYGAFDNTTDGLVEFQLDITGDSLALSPTNILDPSSATNFLGRHVRKMDDDLTGVYWSESTDPHAIGHSSTQTSPVGTVTFYSNSSNQASELTTSRMLVVWEEGFVGNWDMGARTIDISDTLVTVNSNVLLLQDYTNDAAPLAACNFSSGNCCVVARLIDSPGDDGTYAILIGAFGATPILSSRLQMSTDYFQQLALINTGADEAYCFYNPTFPGPIRARQITRSGNAIGLGTETTLFSGTDRVISAAAQLDANTVIIGYTLHATGGGYIQSVDISGVPSLNGDEIEVGSVSTIQAIGVIPPNRIIVGYTESGTGLSSALYSTVPVAAGCSGQIYIGSDLGGLTPAALTDICIATPDCMDIKDPADRLFLASYIASLEVDTQMVLYSDPPNFDTVVDWTDNHQTDKQIEAIRVINSGFV